VPQEQFSTQIDSDVLASVRNLAQEEGDNLVEEALRDLDSKASIAPPRNCCIPGQSREVRRPLQKTRRMSDYLTPG
jgi:hypothetical protein